MAVCADCGAPIVGKWKHCPSCGADLVKSRLSPTEPDLPRQSERTWTIGQQVVLFIAALALLGAVVWSLIPFSNGAVSCSAAVTQAWEKIPGPSYPPPLDDPVNEALARDQGKPTACARYAQSRLKASGVAIGLALVAGTIGFLIFRSSPSAAVPHE